MIERIHRHPSCDEAVVSCGEDARLTYADLCRQIERCARSLRNLPRPALVFQRTTNRCGSLIAYLACRMLRLPLALLDDETRTLQKLVADYGPTAVLSPSERPPLGGYRPHAQLPFDYRLDRLAGCRAYAVDVAPELQLLLATSGSTGNAKLVRLSEANLNANAESIATYLGIRRDDRSIQSLPMQYSYGLSLVNSHLWAGGMVVFSPHSFIRPEFWSDFDGRRCTSFAGVPYIYQTLHRLRFDAARHPTLHTLTQAGGALRPDLIQHYHEMALRGGQRFFVMYGQTEATARISYVPPDRLDEKLGAIGVPIPGGSMRLEPLPNGRPSHEQLVYEGPNVMLGYARSRQDLMLGDRLGGVLRTGDLAQVDEDGFFRLCGRLKRIAKLYGRRLSLADVEHEVEHEFHVSAAVVEGENQIIVFVERAAMLRRTVIRQHLAKSLAVPPAAVKVEGVDTIPLTTSGKKDYTALVA